MKIAIYEHTDRFGVTTRYSDSDELRRIVRAREIEIARKFNDGFTGDDASTGEDLFG